MLTKNGKKIHTLENIIGIFDKNDILVEFWGYVNDITEKRNAEIALRNAALKKRHFIKNFCIELKTVLILLNL